MSGNCKLLENIKADHQGSHIISHLLMNEVLSEEEGDNRNKGILFEIGSRRGVKYEFGRGVLPDKLEKLSHETLDKKIERNSNLSTRASLYSTKAEQLMGEIENKASVAWKKIKNSNSLTEKELDAIYDLLILQIMRLGHSQLHDFTIQPEWVNACKNRILSIPNKDSEILKFQVIKLVKKSKTSGIFVFNSYSNNIKYLFFDDVIIATSMHEIGLEDCLSETFFGAENHLELNSDKNILLIQINEEHSSLIFDNLQTTIINQEYSIYEELAYHLLNEICGISDISKEDLRSKISTVILKINSSTVLTREQFGYLFLTMNLYTPRNIEIEIEFFGELLNHFYPN